MLIASCLRFLAVGALAATGLVASAATSAVSRLVLVNAATQKDIRQLKSGDTITLSVDGSSLNIRAEASGSVSSIGFTYDGKLIHTENDAPYAMAKDDKGVYRKWTPAVGTHKLRATPYSKDNRGGTAGTPLEITFTVISKPAATTPPAGSAPKLTKFALINTSTQKELRELKNGDTINLAADGSALNIRADATGAASIGFTYDGKLIHTENTAPFAMAKDDNGVYRKWTPTVGTHTLRATPYPKTDRGGTAGTPLEITFTVVSSTPKPSEPKPPQTDPEPEPKPSPSPLPKGVSLYKADGSLDLAMYGLFAYSYDKDTMEMRLGPSFSDLSPKAADDRPTLYRPPSYARTSGYIRTNPYELGGPPKTDSDYWSESGQVAYVPDDVSDPGLDRVQVYAYYDRVFAISPRRDYASGTPSPDPQTREPYYAKLFGELPKYPVAMARNYGMQCNEALVIYRDGYLGVAGTQTSRNGSERPYPGFVFPAHKVPTNIALTSENEFALVTIWDTETKKGQLAVFALEGKYIPFHTWPYMGLPNQGSWSAIKLLGYVDLPMNTPTAVSAASNGWWSGPSQTGNKVLSQIDLSNESQRKNIYSGSWNGAVAKGGYAIVASKFDDKVAIVDLEPLFSYVRESYLSSATSFKNTLATRGPGAKDFPQAFSERASIKPKVVWQSNVSKPNAVLAGIRLDRWTKDHYKAYVASEDGTISIIDTSSLMKRNSWEKLGSLRITGTFNVGRNPVSMCFSRRGASNLPLLPQASDGKQSKPDPLNNLFYVAVRGDRKVVGVVTYEGKGAVYRTIKDKRMGDPVAVSTAIRGPILSVTDFRGKKLISFRVGEIDDLRNKKVFGCGPDGKDPVEYAGEVTVKGYPFLVNTTNVN